MPAPTPHPEPWADLPTLAVGDLAPLVAADFPAGAFASLDDDRVFRRIASARWTVRHDRAETRATRLLDRLPAPGESVHVVTSGGLPSWAIVGAVLRLAAPERIEKLSCATLGFGREHITDLARLLDARQIGSVALLVSNYFQSVDGSLFDDLRKMLGQRSQPIAAARVHCKLLAFRIGDGTPLVCESSANLRSCKSAEQFCLTNDPGLLDFHERWIADLLARATTKGNSPCKSGQTPTAGQLP